MSEAQRGSTREWTAHACERRVSEAQRGSTREWRERSRRARHAVMALLVSMQAACAAQARQAPELGELVEIKPPEVPPELKTQEAPAFERILGSFAIAPEPIILLTPRVLEAHFDRTHGDDGFAVLVDRFHELGVPEKEAAALLDWGAVLWFLGRPQDAYARMMDAHRIYAELGDVSGLAHAYEWLGYFLKNSDAIAMAAEHLAVAYQMYEVAGDRGACTRVLSYAH
jgi:hypothetical protein